MQPVQRLDVPAGADELGGQPVEQLGVAGRLALHAEVLGGLHQAGAEELLPGAVDRHAGRQRVVRRRPASAPGRAGCSGTPAGSGGRPAGTPGATFSPGLSYAPRTSTNVSRGCGRSSMTITDGDGSRQRVQRLAGVVQLNAAGPAELQLLRLGQGQHGPRRATGECEQGQASVRIRRAGRLAGRLAASLPGQRPPVLRLDLRGLVRASAAA